MGVVVGVFIAMAALGGGEATMMEQALASRTGTLEASAVISGATPLLLGAVATPLAAVAVQEGTLYRLAVLVVIGMFALFFTVLSFLRVQRAGVQVDLRHH